MAVYGLRLTAATLNTDFTFRCQEEDKGISKKKYHHRMYQEQVLPWLQGTFPAPPQKTQRNETAVLPSTSKTCRGFGKHPLQYMIGALRKDFRNMALQLVGLTPAVCQNFLQQQHQLAGYDYPPFVIEQCIDQSNKKHVDTIVAKEMKKRIKPLLSNVTIDDVAIHFRCGDVIGIDTDTYGLIRFDFYRDNISFSAATIGIITQSFQTEQNREVDGYFVAPCQTLTESLVEYLQSYFPDAVVSIRNHDETPALSYARLILAKQVFAGISTFSIFPALASFGIAYIPANTKFSYFVPPLLLQNNKVNDIQMRNVSVLTSNQIKHNFTNIDDVILWLRGLADGTKSPNAANRFL